MNKQEFLIELRKKLAGLPQADVEERVLFYCEMIDDRMEDGLSEEEAVAAIGDIDEIVSLAITDIPLSKLVKEKIRPKGKLSTTTIVLLILGAPIWLSLIISALSVVFSLFVLLWSVIISLWAVFFSLAVSGVAVTAGGIGALAFGNGIIGLAATGAGIVCAGLSLLTLLGSNAATKGAFKLTKKIALEIKKCFIGKEKIQ